MRCICIGKRYALLHVIQGKHWSKSAWKSFRRSREERKGLRFVRQLMGSWWTSGPWKSGRNIFKIENGQFWIWQDSKQLAKWDTREKNRRRSGQLSARRILDVYVTENSLFELNLGDEFDSIVHLTWRVKIDWESQRSLYRQQNDDKKESGQFSWLLYSINTIFSLMTVDWLRCKEVTKNKQAGES